MARTRDKGVDAYAAGWGIKFEQLVLKGRVIMRMKKNMLINCFFQKDGKDYFERKAECLTVMGGPANAEFKECRKNECLPPF